jgi:hypothetical protein
VCPSQHGESGFRAGFLRGRSRPAAQVLIAFIDACMKVFGVQPICRVLSEHDCKIATSSMPGTGKKCLQTVM